MSGLTVLSFAVAVSISSTVIATCVNGVSSSNNICRAAANSVRRARAGARAQSARQTRVFAQRTPGPLLFF